MLESSRIAVIGAGQMGGTLLGALVRGGTVDGLMALEDGGLRVALIKAVEQATLKSREIQI